MIAIYMMAKHMYILLLILLQVKQAVKDGYDLRGYHYWTLLDDYEFNYGYDLKFGLYAWDPKDKESQRTQRAGAKVPILFLAPKP